MEQDPGKLFFNDGYQLAKSEMNGNPDKKSIFRALKKMYQSIDELNESLLNFAGKQGIKVDCCKGCAWCCHQPVFANSYELHYLSEYIRTNFQKQKQKEILRCATEKNKKVSTLSEDAVLKYKSPCPMLENGACSSYEARPMACRIYLSTKLESCLEFYHHPENEKDYPALLDFPLLAGKMMNEGFIEALKETGIGIAEFRLEEGLTITMAKSWQEENILK